MLHAIRHMRRPDPVPILPPGWFEVPGHGPVAEVSRTYETVGGLRIIHSLDVLDDDEEWEHVSVSRRNRLPSWDDLVLVKERFVGPEREALQLLPKRSEHINLARHCLHIWARTSRSRVVMPEDDHG